jgi:hypothetical protein
MKRKRPSRNHPWVIANARHWAQWKAKQAAKDRALADTIPPDPDQLPDTPALLLSKFSALDSKVL